MRVFRPKGSFAWLNIVIPASYFALYTFCCLSALQIFNLISCSPISLHLLHKKKGRKESSEGNCQFLATTPTTVPISISVAFFWFILREETFPWSSNPHSVLYPSHSCHGFSAISYLFKLLLSAMYNPSHLLKK